MRETGKHIEAFEIWLQGGRSIRTVCKQLSVSEVAVCNWIKAFAWHARADERDRELKLHLEREAMSRRVKVLEDQRIAGELLRRRGVEYFRKTELDDGRVALAAITKGVELERQAENIPPSLLALLALDDAELEAEQQRTQRRVSPALDQPDPGGAAEPESDDAESESGEG